MRIFDGPIVERGLISEVFVDGILRIDHMGSSCHIHYFAAAMDPEINNGEPFRVPIIKHIWTVENFLRTAGSVRKWVDGGCSSKLAEQGLLMPALRTVQ